VDDTLGWLDDNQDAEEDDYREKLKEVEDICSPVVSAAYQADGGAEADDDDLEDHDELKSCGNCLCLCVSVCRAVL